MMDLPLPAAFQLLLHTDDQDQWPPEATLLLAAYHGNVGRLKEIARRLDESGRGVASTLRRTTYEGQNALHAAAGGDGLLPVCRYLVEEVKMDVNKLDTCKGRSMTPLQHAVFGGNLPVVRYLLDHGADIHREGCYGGHEGYSALHTAAEKGRCEIAKVLLARGANVDGKSSFPAPVELAVFGGHETTLKILLDHYADINENVCLSKPLNIALNTPSLSCLKLLIQAGAEVNAIGVPLAKAAHGGLTEAIKLLLEAGANPNIPDMYGRMPIEVAAMCGTREEVEILFPSTSPIPCVTNWSIDGIINHVKLERKQLEDDDFVAMRKSELSKQGDDAFKKQDYINSSSCYTQAVRIDPYDATLFSERSRCWLHMGDGERALQDAVTCQSLCPKWAKAFYQQGEALILLKEYEKACDTLSEGLELDPQDDDMEKLYWEAMELKNDGNVVA